MKYKVGYYQFKPHLLEPERNLAVIEAALASVEADLLVLPELAASGYLFSSRDEVERMAESAQDGPTATTLRRLAASRDVSLVAGFAEREGDNIFNSAMLVNPDGSVYVYRKTHLFADEKSWFAPGDSGFRVFEAKGGVPVGLMVCFDWIFPESARTLMQRGAHILCHPANLVLPWCQQAMITRCIENRVFAITANRYGAETGGGKSLTFTGQSQVTAPDGEVMGRAPEQDERLFIVTIDPDRATNKNITERNHVLNDRRPELYER
ncbi:MAG: beta-ureidopropionase [Candidatus Cloacimonetes bacterium]|nr:beta-ureidopropionase [Candidatus Cloacimonadota bacterium]